MEPVEVDGEESEDSDDKDGEKEEGPIEEDGRETVEVQYGQVDEFSVNPIIDLVG